MRTPTVAVYALAALAALDLIPTFSDPSAQSSIPETDLRSHQLTLGEAAQATPISAIARPELAEAQLDESFVVGEVGTSRLARSVAIADIQDHWAKSYIETLRTEGIIQGYPDGTFRPDTPITSDHFATMIKQATDKHGIRFLVGYIDSLLSINPTLSGNVPPVSPNLSAGVLERWEDQIIGNITTKPASKPLAQGTVTRAEAVAFIYQALSKAGLVSETALTLPPAKMARAVGDDRATKALLTNQVEQRDISLQESPSLNQPLAVSQEPLPVPPEVPATESPSPTASESGQSSVPPSPTIEPPPSAQREDSASKEIQPATASSQLGQLVTGNQSGNFLDYWSTLCKDTPKDAAEAIAACDQILTIKPKDATVWAIRGNLLLGANRATEAVASYDRALALTTPTSELHLKRCKALSAQGNQDVAIAACDQALELDKAWGESTPATAWFTKATVLKRLGRNQDASAAFERSLALAPDNAAAWTEQCRVLSELGQHAAAIAACDRALAINANWGELSPAIAWQNRALALTRLEQYADAIEAYDRALALNPKDASAWTRQGVLFSKLGNYTQALISHDQAVKISANHSLALINRCATLNKLGQYEPALAACDQAMIGDGRWNEVGVAYAWDQRNTALAGLGRLDEALASADRAVSSNPTYAEAWSNRAVTLWRQSKYPEALASVERSVTLKPNYSQGWFNQGRILRSMERYEAAIAAYDKALQGDVNPKDKPTLADIWANRSAVQWRMGQFEAALDSTNQAVKMDPKSTLAWYNQGGILMALKKPQDAARAYEQVLQLDPKDELAWTGHGVALERSGKFKEALMALDEALRLNPEQSLAQQSRETVLKKLQAQRSAPAKGRTRGVGES